MFVNFEIHVYDCLSLRMTIVAINLIGILYSPCQNALLKTG